jgi:dTDP-4-amino-4,6-dideoxygalactose transaminase
MPIKFVDLASQDREIREPVAAQFAAIALNAAYVAGPQVAAFEAEFAEYLGVRHVVAVSSGTDALRLALLALEVGPGDEVITTPMTFIATVEAIVQTGARPVFVDVDQDSCNLSVRALASFLQRRRLARPGAARVVLPVHLYGLPAALPPMLDLARSFGLEVLEDACQAHGARLLTQAGWKRAGTIGAAGCFSFYPGKNLGAWGEGGAVSTDDDGIARRVANLRDHGRDSHYSHTTLGYNARLDTMQAAVLRAKLERLESWNQRRREIAARYREMLAQCDLILPREFEGFESCFHLFVIRSQRRDAIRKRLIEAGIECSIHYPLALHLQPACQFLGYKAGDFPVSEEIARTALSLPMHPHLTDSEVEQVAETISKVSPAS